MTKKSTSSGVAGILFIALAWNGFIGFFDVIIARQVVAERHARSHFEEVPANILSSTVLSQSSSDNGTTYTPEITYSYQFEGQLHTSDRYAYTLWGSSDRDLAYSIIADYPVGSETVARVDPDDPTEAVLDVSGRTFPSLMLLLMTPFHCIGLWLLSGFLHGLRRRNWTADDVLRDKFVLVDDARRFVLKRPHFGFVDVFLGMLLATTFVSIFPLAFGFGMGGASPYVLPVFVVCFSGSVWVAVWRRAAGRTPENFLLVDRDRGLFSYPADALGESMDRIERLEVRSTETGTSVNHKPIMRHVFEVVMVGQTHEVFRHRGSQEDAADIRRLLEAALTAPYAGADRHAEAA